jgi:hypothetical protein
MGSGFNLEGLDGRAAILHILQEGGFYFLSSATGLNYE